MQKICLLLIALSLMGWIQVASAEQEQPRSIVAVRMTEGEPIHLDGKLEESVWNRAEPGTGFLQQEPSDGVPATEETEVYVAYDSDNLYRGAILYDSDPDGILAYQKQRE